MFSFMWLGLCISMTCMFGTNWAPNKWKAIVTVTETGSLCFVHTVRSEMRGRNQAVKVNAVHWSKTVNLRCEALCSCVVYAM